MLSTFDRLYSQAKSKKCIYARSQGLCLHCNKRPRPGHSWTLGSETFHPQVMRLQSQGSSPNPNINTTIFKPAASQLTPGPKVAAVHILLRCPVFYCHLLWALHGKLKDLFLGGGRRETCWCCMVNMSLNQSSCTSLWGFTIGFTFV